LHTQIYTYIVGLHAHGRQQIVAAALGGSQAPLAIDAPHAHIEHRQNRVKLLHQIATLHLQVNVPTHENAQLVQLK